MGSSVELSNQKIFHLLSIFDEMNTLSFPLKCEGLEACLICIVFLHGVACWFMELMFV